VNNVVVFHDDTYMYYISSLIVKNNRQSPGSLSSMKLGGSPCICLLRHLAAEAAL
jgi:hypothetical protein